MHKTKRKTIKPKGDEYMRLKLIACKAVARELGYLCAKSQNNIDITYLRQGNHRAPDVLRRVLQEEIDLVESGKDYHTNETRGDSPYMKDDFDAILIGYGLCSNGIVGISSSRYKLVIPKAHDCITFLLGSKEKYSQYFSDMPGTFWYTMSWIECGAAAGGNYLESEIQYYKDKGYDEDEIEYLTEASRSWIKNYKTAAYIKMPFFDKEDYQKYTEEAAKSCGWDYRLIEGDMALMEELISGRWDDGRFLVVPPKNKVATSYDENVICFTES